MERGQFVGGDVGGTVGARPALLLCSQGMLYLEQSCSQVNIS